MFHKTNLQYLFSLVNFIILMVSIHYSNVEMVNMHFDYGLTNGDMYQTRRLYVEKYPNNHIPSSKLPKNLHQRNLY